MIVSSSVQVSSQDKQREMSVFTRKPARKRPTTSSRNKPVKKVRFAVSPGRNEDAKNLAIVSNESAAMARANDIQARLSNPSFVKQMKKSHISDGFWLGLPKEFCVKHLPTVKDLPGTAGVAVYLEDEHEQTKETKYLIKKVGLSGGWRRFSIDHSLVAGDVLVFELIQPRRMKVHICRGNGSAEIDGALGNLKLGSQPELLSIEAAKDEDDEEEDAEMDTSDNSSEEPSSLDSVGDFKVNTFEEFKIVMDGLKVDSLLSKDIRAKYFNLCTSQKDFLHRNFNMKGNDVLNAGIILEIVNIADAARAANLSTPLKDLKEWDDTLNAFEGAGMAVGFIREHFSKLIALHSEQAKMVQKKRAKRAELEEESKYLRAKIANARGKIDRPDMEMEGLRVNYAAADVEYLEKANAPW